MRDTVLTGLVRDSLGYEALHPVAPAVLVDPLSQLLSFTALYPLGLEIRTKSSPSQVMGPGACPVFFPPGDSAYFPTPCPPLSQKRGRP